MKAKTNSLLTTFGRNVKAYVLKHRKTVYYGFVRVLICLLFGLSLMGMGVGGLCAVDGILDWGVVFFGFSTGTAMLALCAICFVPSVRRALFWE